MCVIAFAPEGVELPSETIRSDMWYSNSDGAGMMYVLNKRVYIEKGFMDIKSFENAIAGVEKKLRKQKLTSKDIPFLLHYRIGTHGPNSEGLTHPFPITPHNDMMQALDLYTDVGVAHNGIIYSVTPKNTISDTMQYIKDVLVPLYRSNPEFYVDDNIQDLIDNTIDGSRLAIIDRKGQFVLLGHWVELDEAPGVLFSNKLFDFKPVYNYGHKYGKQSTKKISVKKVPKAAGFHLFNKGDGKKKNDSLWEISSDSYRDYFVDLLGNVYVESYYDQTLYTQETYFNEIIYITKDGGYERLHSDDEVIKEVVKQVIEVDLEFDEFGHYY